MKTSRKSRCKRNQAGGGLGGVVQFTPGSPLINNDLSWKAGSSCLAEQRFGFLPNGYTGPKGLPGMSGGRRRKSKSKSKRSKRVQKGGRYAMGEFDGVGMGTPYSSGLGPIVPITGDCSRSSIPDSGAAGTLNVRGGPLWDGPVAPRGMIGGGSPTSASPSEIVPTARYSDLADPAGITTSAGTKLMIHTPLNAAQMNPACLKTGGARRTKSRRGTKKHRKSRKGTKGRKH
jgi:hypothetical protein